MRYMAQTPVPLYHSVLRVARIHFFYVLAFSASIIVFDASQLIAPDAVLLRWKYVAALMVITTAVWYGARLKPKNDSFQKTLLLLLVAADIIFASVLVYADRGMASLAVALYAIPIVSAASLFSRSSVLAAAALSLAGYAFASIKYFVDYFNEGYKVQLYSSIGFYGASFFILALLLVAVIDRGKKK